MPLSFISAGRCYTHLVIGCTVRWAHCINWMWSQQGIFKAKSLVFNFYFDLFMIKLVQLKSCCSVWSKKYPFPNMIQSSYFWFQVFVFSIQNKASSWAKFDWTKLTTVVSVGYLSSELMCLAHRHGARVINIGQFIQNTFLFSFYYRLWLLDNLNGSKR